MLNLLKPLPLILALAAIAACSGESVQVGSPEPGGEPDSPVQISDTDVTGEIRSTSVQLDKAEFDGDLAIFEGENWGLNPSLLIFLFLDEDVPPEGRTIAVTPVEDSSASAPVHVHYRWRDPQTGEINVEVLTDGYQLELEFGVVTDNSLPGHIEFSVPDRNTSVSGAFRADIEIQ